MDNGIRVSNELEKIKAMVSFMADSTDLILSSTIENRQNPMIDTPYGMHLFFMELITKIENASKRVEKLGDNAI